MNRRFPWIGLALGLFLGMGSPYARAQNVPYSPYGQPNYSPYSRPVVSPYLNIIRGNNPAINYFNVTIPERENRARFNQVNSEIQNLERRPAAPEVTTNELIPSLPETGHLAQFGNVNPYYSYAPGFNQGALQAGAQANRPRPGTGTQPPPRR